MGVRLGLDGKLFRNTGTFAAPVWIEILNVKDVTLNLEAGEADVTTRGNGGWKATVPTLKDASLEFEMVWDPGDANFAAFRDAFLFRTPIEMAILDGDVTAAGAQGLRASFAVMHFTRNEPLEEAMTASVSVKPTYAAVPPLWWIIPA